MLRPRRRTLLSGLRVYGLGLRVSGLGHFRVWRVCFSVYEGFLGSGYWVLGLEAFRGLSFSGHVGV